MIGDFDISLTTPSDIPGILALQEPNLPDSGGSLSVRSEVGVGSTFSLILPAVHQYQETP